MLSFLHEQGSKDLPLQGASDNHQQEPVATNKGQSQEFFSAPTQTRNARRSTMLVVVLFSIGLLILLFMIRKSKPQTASALPACSEDAQIELAISKLTGGSTEMIGRMDQILKKFYEFSNVLQVKVNELVKNPFELEMFLSDLRQQNDVQGQSPDIDLKIIHQQRLIQKAKEMQLLSIIRSDQGSCCMIDGNIFYEGDVIKDFKIIKISNVFVILEWVGEQDGDSSEAGSEGLKVILKLS
jgi:preprotein translocase subunit SecG